MDDGILNGRGKVLKCCTQKTVHCCDLHTRYIDSVIFLNTQIKLAIGFKFQKKFELKSCSGYVFTTTKPIFSKFLNNSAIFSN